MNASFHLSDSIMQPESGCKLQWNVGAKFNHIHTHFKDPSC